ncbi:transmembrane protein, putative (macronuclear) [Tetrahymena thermophila SB210]|uniref:Transmembrane protein, putative n=1 Tax=Tetrahymena thermophila (strain SB210) TaxID=312017 RepID=W7XIU3_TETTS|nr:transmembrane protein, putative [Tetrahymena thermophila SB210]EWS74921.1 transmembrane protein, putative [Tetrahymena thermophila SB210]|eukprot:XP_012652634.1 transmembrane protein, putative [Tetrahymena thermophila SB210]
MIELHKTKFKASQKEIPLDYFRVQILTTIQPHGQLKMRKSLLKNQLLMEITFLILHLLILAYI